MMAENVLKRCEELLTQGTQLIPLGGFDFSGYNARLQNKYLEWRKACLELLEQVNLIPEVASEDLDGQDLDEAALSQLASGLKSEVPSLDGVCGTPLGKEGAEPAVWLSLQTVDHLGRLMVHRFPSLRLHQQISVYRI